MYVMFRPLRLLNKRKKEFPVFSCDVTTTLFLGGNNDVIYKLFLHRESVFSDIPTGEGKLTKMC